MISLLGQVAAPTVAEADSGSSGASGPPGLHHSPYAPWPPPRWKGAQTAGFAPGSISDQLPLSLKRECHPDEGGPRLGAPHDRGVPAGGAGPGRRCCAHRGVTWGSMPTPSSGWSASWRSCPPRLTPPPRPPSAFRTTLDSDSRNVASASSPSSTGTALSNGPISVILGLKPSTGRTTGKETPPMSSGLRPAAGLAQARPDPVPAEWSPLNQALLVWCDHRVSPCGRPRTTWRRGAQREHPPPGP
jgi:hypothetical protein